MNSHGRIKIEETELFTESAGNTEIVFLKTRFLATRE
jgi:hypothetical protein